MCGCLFVCACCFLLFCNCFFPIRRSVCDSLLGKVYLAETKTERQIILLQHYKRLWAYLLLNGTAASQWRFYIGARGGLSPPKSRKRKDLAPPKFQGSYIIFFLVHNFFGSKCNTDLTTRQCPTLL